MSDPQYPDQPTHYPAGGQGYPGYAGHDERPAPSRPGTLLAGCILTWVGSVVGLLLGLLILGLSSSDEFADVFNGAGADVETLLKVLGGVLVVWSLLAAVLAVFVVMGNRWAAIALAVLGGLYTAVVVYGIVTSGDFSGLVGIVWVLGCLALIFSGSKDWFDYKAGKRVNY